MSQGDRTTGGLAVAAPSLPGQVVSDLWLHSRNWDLTWISLSAVLVIMPFAAYDLFNSLLVRFAAAREFLGVKPAEVLDFSRNSVNALIAIFIGGPHMYATFTRTFLDREFRHRRMLFCLGSLLVPVAVVTLGLVWFELLITAFFFWASVHVLQQVAYIADCYNLRAPRAVPLRDRVLDYAVLFTCMYPIGIWRMVNGTFKIGQIQLLFPEFLTIRVHPALGWTLFISVTVVFSVALTLWLTRSWREFRQGELHLPKFLLLGLTAVIGFSLPSYRELDVAFQGFNTWHSFQYLGLTFYINRLRLKKAGIETPLIQSLSMEGRGWRYYFFLILLSVPAGLILVGLLMNRAGLGLSLDQCYYMVVLSVLLIHYYHDSLLFTQRDALIP